MPLDGSGEAEQALPYAETLASRLNIPLHLLRAYALADADWDAVEEEAFTFLPDDARQESLGSLYAEQVLAGERTRAEDYLAKVEARRRQVAQVTSVVREGDAAEAILTEARGHPSTLVLMTSHGRTGLERAVMGSVADRVLRGMNNPLIVVRVQEGAPPAEPQAIRNIVLPLDGSPLAEEVLPHALALARGLDAVVHPTWVIPVPIAVYAGLGLHPGGDRHVLEAMKRAATEYVADIRKRLLAAGVAHVEYNALLGDPAVEIVALAERMPHSLIVMTTHGRSGMGRWVLGSVAERVVHHSKRPVLLVRPRSE